MKYFLLLHIFPTTSVNAREDEGSLDSSSYALLVKRMKFKTNLVF